jgi:ribulose-phosphate 3-epimerase
MNRLIAPSLLSADFSNLKSEINMINQSEADWFHLDVMDGIFVPNISFGIPVIRSIKKHARKPLDVHLMIVEPDRYLEQFRDAGADLISVHYEACTHLHRTVQKIHSLNMKAGVVLNPHTPVILMKDILKELDFVLLMSVNPGYGGQKFIQNTYSKITELKEMIIRYNLETLIEIDGGVTIKNAPELFSAGADVLVAGNTVFSSDDPVRTIHQLKQPAY